MSHRPIPQLAGPGRRNLFEVRSLRLEAGLEGASKPAHVAPIPDRVTRPGDHDAGAREGTANLPGPAGDPTSEVWPSWLPGSEVLRRIRLPPGVATWVESGPVGAVIQREDLSLTSNIQRLVSPEPVQLGNWVDLKEDM